MTTKANCVLFYQQIVNVELTEKSLATFIAASEYLVRSKNICNFNSSKNPPPS